MSPWTSPPGAPVLSDTRFGQVPTLVSARVRLALLCLGPVAVSCCWAAARCCTGVHMALRSPLLTHNMRGPWPAYCAAVRHLMW